MVGEGTNRTYNHIGVPDSFHPLSHHADHLDRIEKLVKIQRYHLERFADFVAKLAETPDGEGTLLDNSMLLYGSNMANSNVHNNYPLPNILVGGGAGALKGGRQIELPERTTISQSAPHAAEQGGPGDEELRRQHRRDRRCLSARDTRP